MQAKEQSDGVLAALPPYALTYDPTVIPQLGKNLPTIDGITGAAGYYYPPGDPVHAMMRFLPRIAAPVMSAMTSVKG